jgi:hypothetical protein
MKDHAKIRKKKGRPTYRTPSSFRYRKSLEVKRMKNEKKGSK